MSTPMRPPRTVGELEIAPLVATARDLRALSLSIVGSAAFRPLHEVADVDVHLAIPRMDEQAYAAVVAAGRAASAALAARAGMDERLELRHGPFKPSPHERDVLQLHLLADDADTLRRTSGALRLHRIATGRTLLSGREEAPSLAPARWVHEAIDELSRLRAAVTTRTIVFRYWRLDVPPRLVRSSAPARTSWELTCLLVSACRSADIHYLSALRVMPVDGATELALPLLDQLGHPGRDWDRLPTRWHAVADATAQILDRRIRHLGRLDARR